MPSYFCRYRKTEFNLTWSVYRVGNFELGMRLCLPLVQRMTDFNKSDHFLLPNKHNKINISLFFSKSSLILYARHSMSSKEQLFFTKRLFTVHCARMSLICFFKYFFHGLIKYPKENKTYTKKWERDRNFNTRFFRQNQTVDQLIIITMNLPVIISIAISF